MIEIPQLLSTLLTQARSARASDIHIQPYSSEFRIRFRIDGLLEERSSITSSIGTQLISRIKVLSQLDVSERRRPQDGTFIDRSCDIRVATFPSIQGEKLVLRLLDTTHTPLRLDQLGIDCILYEKFTAYAKQASGFIIVTGPTGSGKTTTIHALLSTLDHTTKNIVTLEDPVEYTLKGITQTGIHPEIGLTFDAGLRSLLRQDPDVIMVGEIRDRETARVAVQAALTGHQVVSSLHTGDALGALLRLVHMGIEPYLIVGSVKAIVAQRLVRRVCDGCVTHVPPTDEQRLLLKKYGYSVDRLSLGIGCDSCRGTGHQGRIGIFQLLELSPSLSQLFIEGAHPKKLYACALKEGMHELCQNAFLKLKSGQISFSEFMQTTSECSAESVMLFLLQELSPVFQFPDVRDSFPLCSRRLLEEHSSRRAMLLKQLLHQ